MSALMRCRNRAYGCMLVFDSRRDLRVHEQNCRVDLDRNSRSSAYDANEHDTMRGRRVVPEHQRVVRSFLPQRVRYQSRSFGPARQSCFGKYRLKYGGPKFFIVVTTGALLQRQDTVDIATTLECVDEYMNSAYRFDAQNVRCVSTNKRMRTAFWDVAEKHVHIYDGHIVGLSTDGWDLIQSVLDSHAVPRGLPRRLQGSFDRPLRKVACAIQSDDEKSETAENDVYTAEVLDSPRKSSTYSDTPTTSSTDIPDVNLTLYDQLTAMGFKHSSSKKDAVVFALNNAPDASKIGILVSLAVSFLSGN